MRFLLRINIFCKKNQGFTLIEVISVILIISILRVMVISRWTTSSSDLYSQIEVVKAHLRYAQSLAMSTSSNWYVHFETIPAPGRYTLYKAGTPRYFPMERDYAQKLKPGIVLSAEAYVLFDRLGRPYPNTSGAAGTQQTTAQTIITSAVGNIEIKPETGFIP